MTENQYKKQHTCILPAAMDLASLVWPAKLSLFQHNKIKKDNLHGLNQNGIKKTTKLEAINIVNFLCLPSCDILLKQQCNNFLM